MTAWYLQVRSGFAGPPCLPGGYGGAANMMTTMPPGSANRGGASVGATAYGGASATGTPAYGSPGATSMGTAAYGGLGGAITGGQ